MGEGLEERWRELERRQKRLVGRREDRRGWREGGKMVEERREEVD